MSNQIDHLIINLYDYNNGHIRISQIKAVDKEGNYINEHIDLKKVMPLLSSYKVVWRCNK